jgi:cyanophycin synthetase
MNVANALAAAAAAWAAGAHLHDIRQGLRTFSTSFFQAPGRLNELEVNGYKVILDYCHNVDGMRRLTEFVDLMMTPTESTGGNGRQPAGGGQANGRAIGVIGIPGDRRDADMREYGRLAAQTFDQIFVREDANLRGRRPGETAGIVLDGVRRAQAEGARCQQAAAVLKELDAAMAAIGSASAGDLVVMCVDEAGTVYRSVMEAGGTGARGFAIADPGELEVEEG